MIATVLAIILALQGSECARIFGFFIAPSVSHQMVFQPIWKELALRGHQVTVISPHVLHEDIPNLKEIDVNHSMEPYLRSDPAKVFDKENTLVTTFDRMFTLGEDVIENQFENPEVVKLLNGNDTDFDLVLVEAITPAVFAWAGKYKVPVVGIVSMSSFFSAHDSVGNPTHPVLSPESFLNVESNLNFWDRLRSFFYNVTLRLIYHTYWLPRLDKFMRKYFKEDIPYLGDLERNVSLLLVNVNPLMHEIRPNVPAIVEISQMHIKPKKPLPDDIKKFLDESTEGVIYFSLGSNVESSKLPPGLVQSIKEALGELPYKVLWKWEKDDLPGKPQNVKIKKWLPQQDVLGHPNIKAFVTQGGIQSIEEALCNAVPMIGIPFMADQPLNVLKLVDMGVGAYLDYTTMTKEDIKQAILKVAGTPSYKEKALELKPLLTDQPMVGVQKAVWWIEYVLRHKGAKHLVSPARDMPYWKYFCLDVIGFLLLVTGIAIYATYKILTIFFTKKHIKQQKYKTS